MNILIAILLCLNWVSINSLKSIVKREKATEFYIDKDGNIRVNAIKNERLYHYIISPQGKIEKIEGPKIPEGKCFFYNRSTTEFYFSKHFVQTSALKNDIILLTKRGTPLTGGFLPTRQDFPLYEYKIDEKNKKITYQRKIILPGKDIYELKLGTRYVTKVPGGYLRARLIGLGKDYVILLITGYDKNYIPLPQPEVGPTTFYETEPPYPTVYYLLIFKLQKQSKREFRAEIYKEIPITHKQTYEELKNHMWRLQMADYVEGRDKDGNLYYVTFRERPYWKEIILRHSGKHAPIVTYKLLPDFAVKVHLTERLKDLKTEKYPIEGKINVADTGVIKEMKKYKEHFVSLNCGGIFSCHEEGRGLLSVFKDTIVFYYRSYIGKIVFGDGKLKEVEKIESIKPIELSYKDFKRYRGSIEMRFPGDHVFYGGLSRKNYFHLYLYLHCLLPDGTFYHKKFLLLKLQG